MINDKKDGQLVTHVSKKVEMQVKLIAEQSGITSSEYISYLINSELDRKKKEFEFMKSLFVND